MTSIRVARGQTLGQIAQEYGAVLPMGTLVEQLFTSLVANGKGGLDHSALLTVIESLSNFSLTQQPPGL